MTGIAPGQQANDGISMITPPSIRHAKGTIDPKYVNEFLKLTTNMTSQEEVTLPATRPKSRKSLAYIPSAQSMDQENMTADIGAMTGGKRAIPIEKPSRKSRSKSIGPGGLDALRDTTGNRRKVRKCRLEM